VEDLNASPGVGEQPSGGRGLTEMASSTFSEAYDWLTRHKDGS